MLRAEARLSPLLLLLLGPACSSPVKPDAAGTVGTDDTAGPVDTSGHVDTADDTGTTDAPLPCTDVEATESTYVAQGSTVSGTLAGCAGIFHATAGAVNSTLSASLSSWNGMTPLRVTVTDVAGHVLAPETEMRAGESVSFQLWQSGEAFVRLDPETDASGDYTLQVSCADGCDREYTRYPIVLMHGMGGSATFDGVDYFFDVRDDLEARGYLVRNPAVEPFAGSDARALQWQTALHEMIDAGLGRRFNLVAHSQGGIDARYLITTLGEADHVASLVTIGTPHHGTAVADVLSGTVTSGVVSADIVDLGAAAFENLYGIGVSDPSLTADMAYLTTANMEAFNAAVPDAPGVYYASWAGHSCGSLEWSCQDDEGGERIDPLLEPLYIILWASGEDSDGMVPVASAQWGDYRGEVPADHLDEIGQFQDTDNAAFDHLAFYRDEVRRLAAMGL
jgi:triacylglycerol esterase/lipase EstA (alpha/beta hydrolase family)